MQKCTNCNSPYDIKPLYVVNYSGVNVWMCGACTKSLNITTNESFERDLSEEKPIKLINYKTNY